MSTQADNELDDRQRREKEYHEEFARHHRNKVHQETLLDVIEAGPRRPWNAYWSTYDLLLAENLFGKKVLVPGCGFGDDVIRLAKLGADVYGFDLSPDLIAIARLRAAEAKVPYIHFDIMPAEKLLYQNDFFDLIFFNDILHHVDISRAVAEARRVLRTGGKVIANELYTHSTVQRVRESYLVSNWIYKFMVRFIYGTNRPYITLDEHKIDERELSVLEGILRPGALNKYFLFLGGRILPADWLAVSKFDQLFFRVVGSAGRHIAGRVIVSGVVEK